MKQTERQWQPVRLDGDVLPPVGASPFAATASRAGRTVLAWLS